MKKRSILDIYTNGMAFWVVIAAVFAYHNPSYLIHLRPYMKLFFAITMFGIGVVLRPEDFHGMIDAPVKVLIGVIAQFSIMPLSAFAVAKIFHLPPEITVGLVIAGSAPGAMASNVICYIARADVAYSVVLTSISTLLTPLLTPALVYILANSILKVNFFEMSWSLVQMVILPLGSGFIVRLFFKKKIDKIIKVFPAISTTFIVFICALVVALNRERIMGLSVIIVISAVVLNLNGMLMGYGVGKFAGFSIPRRRTLSIEIGMQNAGLGTVLALAYFGPKAAIPTAAFVFICIFTAAIAAAFWRRDKI